MPAHEREQGKAKPWSRPELERLDIDLTSIAAQQKKSGDGIQGKGS